MFAVKTFLGSKWEFPVLYLLLVPPTFPHSANQPQLGMDMAAETGQGMAEGMHCLFGMAVSCLQGSSRGQMCPHLLVKSDKDGTVLGKKATIYDAFHAWQAWQALVTNHSQWRGYRSRNWDLGSEVSFCALEAHESLWRECQHAHKASGHMIDLVWGQDTNRTIPDPLLWFCA